MNNDQGVSRTLDYYLERAKTLAGEDRFGEALDALRDARKLTAGTEVDLVENIKQEIEEARRQRIRALTGDLAVLLTREPGTLTPEDLDTGQKALARLQNVYPNPVELEPLVERWQAHRRRAEVLRDLEETRQQLETSWQAPLLLLSQYDEALALARRKADEHRDVLQFQELLKEAEQKREQAYKEEMKLTTQATEGNFKPLIEELERLKREGKQDLPVYDWGMVEEDGKPKRALVARGYLPAAEAIRRLRELATQYEEGKADDYRGRAQAELPAHPEAAAEWIGDALKFEYATPKKKEELQAFYNETIQPDLDRRQRAVELVEDALQRDKDVVEAWGLLDQATSIDRYAPDIERGRDQVRPCLKVYLEGLLDRATEKRQAGGFETAEEMTDRVREIVGGDEKLQAITQWAQELAKGCDADRDVYEAAGAEAKRIEGLVDANLAAAAQAMADLETTVAGRPERFQQILQGARHAVQAHRSLEALLAEWERRFQTLDPIRLEEREAFRQASNELDRLADEVGQAVAERGRKAGLVDFQRRLEARQHFLQGQLNWEAGLYEKTTAAWEQVIKAGRDDASLARDWLQKARDATAVSQAIEKAQAHQKTGRFKDALDALKDWRTKASPRQGEVQNIYRQIEDEWAGRLEAEIKSLIADLQQRPAYADLIEKVNQLELLRPSKAREYRYDHFPRIYEEWGDLAVRSGQYQEAEEHYQRAADLVRGEAHIRLVGKRRRARRQWVYDQVEKLIVAGKRSEAHQGLMTWIDDAPDDVESLAWLADLFLEDEENERAADYIRWAERRLEIADREQSPARAGLEQLEEIAEWRLRLETMRLKTRAVTDVNQAKQRITARLQPRTSLREYRLAQTARDGLIEQLKQTEQEIQQQETEHPLHIRLSQEAQDRVHRAWREVRRWLGEQVRKAGGISAWYDDVERNLLEQLRDLWDQTGARDVEQLDFRQAEPLADLRRRWETGLKIRYLSRQSGEGELAIREITDALGRLRTRANQLIDDPRGPEYDLKGAQLTPEDALSAQLRWSENLLAWAALLRDLLGGYAWAADKPSKTEEREDTAGTYTVSRESYNKVYEFRKAISNLRRAVQQTEQRLEQAIVAGKDGRRRWEHVNWQKLVFNVLQSPQLPEPLSDGQSQDRTYWNELEHNDVDRRWQAWRRAAEILLEANLSSQSERAPWEIINTEIAGAEIEERWEEISVPLEEHWRSFGQHWVVEQLLQEINEAERLRDRLVLLTVELHTLIQAEESRPALSRMERMETDDADDKYGFRQGHVMRDPQPLAWEELKEMLQAHQRQWEVFQTWWAPVERSALRPWREESRAKVVRLAREAGFEEAIQWVQDALEGTQTGGRTNRLGGGLALAPLLEHLENRPSELESPLSHRLRQALQETDRWHHDAQEAVDELRFWSGETTGQHRPGDIPGPIARLQTRFSEEVEALEFHLGILESIKPWPWKRREKEGQRQLCFELLAGVKQLAPDWPELKTLEQRTREA